MDLFFEKYCLQRPIAYETQKCTKISKNLEDASKITNAEGSLQVKKDPVFDRTQNHIPRSLARHPIIYSAWEKPRQGSSTIRRSNFPGCAPSISFEIHFRGKLEARVPRNFISLSPSLFREPGRPTPNLTTHLGA